LVAARVPLMMRAIDTARISRQSMQLCNDSELIALAARPGQRVLRFKYLPKGRSVHSTKYLPFLTDDDAGLCAARALLDYKTFVDAMLCWTASSQTHDGLFVMLGNVSKCLSPTRVSTATRELMTAAKIPNHFTSHSLRRMVNIKARLFGVSRIDRRAMGNWANASTMDTHYDETAFIRTNTNLLFNTDTSLYEQWARRHAHVRGDDAEQL
jgi:hypothetical protein